MEKKIKKLNPAELNLRSDIIEAGLVRKINEVIDTVNNLVLTKTSNNGETPEVDNTVGQVSIDIWSKFNNDRANIIANCPEGFMQGCAHLLDYLKKNNYLNKPVETDKEEPKRIWKLDCKSKDNNCKVKLKMFHGNALNLLLHIDEINNKNYSYYIVDFEEIGS